MALPLVASQTSLAAISCLTLTFAAILVRRLFIAPLTSVPGPLGAALTGAWIWFLDMRGTSTEYIYNLHQKHGKLVRIGPNEVSVMDSTVFLGVIYKQASPYRKAPEFYHVFANEHDNMFSTSDPELHSQYRRVVSNAFSRKSVLAYEQHIWERAFIMSKQLRAHYTHSESWLDLTKLFRCFALDVVSKYTYGESFDALLKPGFDETLLEAFDKFAPASFFFVMFPRIRVALNPIMPSLPIPVFQAVPKMTARVIAALRDMKADQQDFTPVLEAQVNNGKRQGVEQTVAELAANGIGSIIAGTDTTGMALAIGTRSIYLDEDIRSRLHAELKTVWETEVNHPSLQILESLPYLRACVRECLRFSSPISGRLPRVTPQGGLDFAGHHIPAGTTISSAVYLMHYNEEIFHEPFRFNPDRWLAQDISRLEQCLVPFSTGSRACIGLNIATAEIYIGLATMVRWFKASRVLDRELSTLVHFTRSVPGGLKVELVEAEQ